MIRIAYFLLFALMLAGCSSTRPVDTPNARSIRCAEDAVVAYQNGDYACAMALVDLLASDIARHEIKGKLYLRSGNYRDARAHLKAAIEQLNRDSTFDPEKDRKRKTLTSLLLLLDDL